MTTQQDALYRAVCEYPDEDTPRLIFADCVEEDGDAIRAAFIRTQIELARVPEYDPLWSHCRHRDPNAILGWSLTYPLPSLPAGLSWREHRTRRGFSWQASVTDIDAFLASGPALFAAAPIQALHFEGGTAVRTRLAEIADCPHLERLRRIEFSLARLDKREAFALGMAPRSSNVTELSFTNNAITAEGLEVLAGSPLFGHLIDLNLERPALPPALLVDALAAAAPDSLRRLAIADCLLPAADTARLLSLPLVERLETLDASDNPLRGEGVEALANCRSLGRLEVLKLGRTNPGVAGIRALARSRVLNSLRWLDLSSNRLGPMAVRVLADSPLARGLNVLDLSNNPIGDAGAAVLASSANLESLRELVLRNAAIGDRGALALAESPVFTGLLRLDLRDSTSSAGTFDPAVVRKLAVRFGPRVSADLQ
jgi:uncharacterized protein (TIGR02996 family)